MRLIKDSARPFWKCIWGTLCWESIPLMVQNSSKVLDVNSAAPSVQSVRIGCSGNWDLSLRMWVRILGKTRLRVESSDTLDHLELASITTRKYRNGPLGGSIGPHTSA